MVRTLSHRIRVPASVSGGPHRRSVGRALRRPNRATQNDEVEVARAVEDDKVGDVGRSSGEVECVGEGQAVTCSITNGDEPDLQAETGGPLAALLTSALLISPFFFWGTSMVAMKIAAPHSTPLFTAAVRLIPAGVAVVAWAVAARKPLPTTAAAWTAVTAFAIVDGTLFQGFLAEGLQRVPAGLGSVIIDSQPLTVAVAASLLFGESLTIVGAFGLLLGILGLLLLEVPLDVLQAWTRLHFDASLPGGPWWENGQLLMLLAAQSMAAGTLMVPWVSKSVDPVMATGWHMILGGVPLLLGALLTEPQLADNLAGITAGDVGALTYTSLLGGAAAYAVFFYNASKGNLTKLSSLTFLTPVFAALGGYLLLQETLTPVQLLGASVTLAGVLTINIKSKED